MELLGGTAFDNFWWYMTDGLKAATPVTVGILTVIVARQQSQTNARKLKLDTFERRYKIYTKVKDVLDALEGGARIPRENLNELHRLADEAIWLFSPEKGVFIATIPNLANKLEVVQKRNENSLLTPQQQKANEKDFDELSEKLDKSINYLVKEFGKDLDLSKV